MVPRETGKQHICPELLTFLYVVSPPNPPSRPMAKKRLSYLNYCSSSLYNLPGRGVIFLTLQMGKERDARFDGFVTTM